jgi:hypothetical protein
MIINANPQLQQPDDKPTSDQGPRDFFKESAGLWDAVVSADSEYRRPIGPSTAHHLMESFNRLLRFNPEHVLKLAWRLITDPTLGYQFDQMAIGEFVEVNAVRFAEILDVFVSAGWQHHRRQQHPRDFRSSAFHGRLLTKTDICSLEKL